MQRIYTTRQAGELCGGPEWLVRRIVDNFEEPVVKFGNKRMIPESLLPVIRKAIAERQGGRAKREVSH